MVEKDVVRGSTSVRTRESLTSDLTRLGIQAGGVLIIHSSLKAVGWIAGGPAAVLHALSDVVTSSGTLVMPAQSQDLTDPVRWENPSVPAEWHDEIRRSMPAYDRERTPTRDMGRIAELFRTWPGVLRSDHPTSSFAAWGSAAETVVSEHPLNDPFGEASPLAKLYDLDAKVLLLGVAFEACTALHLAERRAWPDQQTVPEGSPMMVNGTRSWVQYETPLLRTDLLEEAGEHLMGVDLVRSGPVGSARSHLVPLRSLVDTAACRWRSERFH
ncbi:MAG: aminoglycoside N(3)-acetyltransferase [Janthinobacterium lividum]